MSKTTTFQESLPRWARTLILLEPVALVLALFCYDGCIKHRDVAQRATETPVITADSLATASYGDPVVEAKVRRSMAVYDSLLALTDARDGVRLATGIYVRAGQILLDAIETIEQAGNVMPPNYVGLAELARTEWSPRFYAYESMTAFGRPFNGDDRDWYALNRLSAEYIVVLECGLGQATRK